MKTRFVYRACLLAALLVAAPVGARDANAEVSQLRPYYMKDGLDLGEYRMILIDSLGLEDARVMAPPWIQGEARSPEKWRLTSRDIRFLRESYRAAMREQIGEIGGYPIVTRPGPGVLIADVEIVALMPYARKDEDVTTRGFGEILVQAQFRDGSTEELLAVFEGWQDVGSEYQQNTRLNAENSLRELFSVWGRRIVQLLDADRD